jgi:glucose-6-phosphate 1-dehydrogenase
VSRPERSDALVLFGATGDLARKKLFPALYHLTRQGRLDLPLVGVARSRWTDTEFADHARDAIRKAVDEPDPAVLRSLCDRLVLVRGDYADPAIFASLSARLDELGVRHPTCYLAIPPSAFPEVAKGLASAGLDTRGRLVVEKPFGRDLASAMALNRLLHEHFAESQIFRIDHYLAKEAVEDLLVFRFGNTFLEPVFNRNYIDNVQITMAEAFGVEGRGAFYEEVGALRDVVQNHLLQVVGMLAMEPPAGSDPEALRDESHKVLRATRALDTDTVVRGQFAGYHDEAGVKWDSQTETFVAARLQIDSWRWAGVPFYIRTGKRLAETALEAVVEFRCPPTLLFAEAGTSAPEPNLLRFRLGNQDGVTLTVQAKTPGPGMDTQPVDLAVDFAAALGDRQEAYERLLDDALDGNQRRFARTDMVEQAWRIVQPVLDDPGKVHRYQPGSWGPAEADQVLDGDRWHDPEG